MLWTCRIEISILSVRLVTNDDDHPTHVSLLHSRQGITQVIISAAHNDRSHDLRQRAKETSIVAFLVTAARAGAQRSLTREWVRARVCPSHASALITRVCV
jgi:hypothetical protein